ncbi:hypothetical protein ACTWP5_05870 [Streptomyces sp. 4N509B]|uniref:hypothetical protein n=1 Tax=Streptomyces sp. 4N509B TaxID=3457413 RepID=UPI003FD62C7B
MTNVAYARRAALYVLAVLLIYAVISFPDRSTEFVGLGFRAVSLAAEGLGDLLADAVS